MINAAKSVLKIVPVFPLSLSRTCTLFQRNVVVKPPYQPCHMTLFHPWCSVPLGC